MNIECSEVGVTYYHVDKDSPLTNGCHRRTYLRIKLCDVHVYTWKAYIDIYGWSTDIDSKFLKLLQHWNCSNKWAYAPLKSEEL